MTIYEILKDEGRRTIYNRVLVEGLPDWRSPIYYYRRARKMSLLEISIIIMVVTSIAQYLMAWGSYIDRKHTMVSLENPENYEYFYKKRIFNSFIKNLVE